MNNQVSTFDKVTMAVAVLALVSTCLSTYFQHFKQHTELSIGEVAVEVANNDARDTLYVSIDAMLSNTGDNPVAFGKFDSYLSLDGNIPDAFYYDNDAGAISRNDTTVFTYLNPERVNRIIEKNSVVYVKTVLPISAETALDFFNIADSTGHTEELFSELGLAMSFTDSKGESKSFKKSVFKVSMSLMLDEEMPKIQAIGYRSLKQRPDLRVY